MATCSRLLFLSVLSLLSTSPRAEPVTCSTSISHTTTRPTASVTCHFHIDLKANKHAFNIEYRPFDSGDSGSGTGVLLCSWIKRTGMLQCFVQDGYSFDYNVTDQVTLQIPCFEKSHSGEFKCHIVPPDGRPVQPCNLTSEAKPVLSNKTLMEKSTDSTLPPNTSTTSSTSSVANVTGASFLQGSDKDQGIALPIACVVGVLGAIVLVLVICVVVRRRSRALKTEDVEETKDKMEPLLRPPDEQNRENDRTDTSQQHASEGTAEETNSVEKNGTELCVDILPPCADEDNELPLGMHDSGTVGDDKELSKKMFQPDGSGTNEKTESHKSSVPEKTGDEPSVGTLPSCATEESECSAKPLQLGADGDIGEDPSVKTFEPGGDGKREGKPSEEALQPCTAGENTQINPKTAIPVGRPNKPEEEDLKKPLQVSEEEKQEERAVVAFPLQSDENIEENKVSQSSSTQRKKRNRNRNRRRQESHASHFNGEDSALFVDQWRPAQQTGAGRFMMMFEFDTGMDFGNNYVEPVQPVKQKKNENGVAVGMLPLQPYEQYQETHSWETSQHYRDQRKRGHQGQNSRQDWEPNLYYKPNRRPRRPRRVQNKSLQIQINQESEDHAVFFR